MEQDDLEFRIWEISTFPTLVEREGRERLRLLASAFEANRLVQQSRFVWRSGLLRLQASVGTESFKPRGRRPGSEPPLMEQRLVALFDE